MQAKHLVPNTLTLGNLSCGFLAIAAATEGAFTRAILLLFFAVICDTLDGRAARLLKATSQFGMELDSLSDCVSFGLAPAVLVYLAILRPLGLLGQAVAVLYLICAAIRLARFNVDSGPLAKLTFFGLPTPAAAGYMMSLVLLRGQMSLAMAVGCVLLVAGCMVSTLKVPKLGPQASLPGWLLVFELLTFVLFLARPSMLTWHIWNGWNCAQVLANYVVLSKRANSHTS
jgi:CDP-diacylglycerol--serine O-phosphatidyltransferase